jgi:hypothetical protein
MVQPESAPVGRPRIKLPPLFYVASFTASLCIAAGVIGLFAPAVFPPLAEKAVAYAFLGVGIVLELWSVSIVVTTARQLTTARQQRRP